MELYHLCNRGVEKRNIFLDDQDRKRFIQGLQLFNDTRSIDNMRRLLETPDVRLRKSNKIELSPLVDIHAWCVMKNHYHLLVSEKEIGSLTKFLRKLNIGYAKYFNERYRRSGTLFQGRTKRIHIHNDKQLLHIINYIHLNPLDYLTGAENWRQYKIKNTSDALKHIESYPWSSYSDYSGTKNFGFTNTSFYKDIYKNYPNALKKYLSDIETTEFSSLNLE
ncbi:transposase [Candidatus Parcubacteria bacterium]|nr:transposase [Candidatus Parcubacteria bacterium]